MRPTAAGAGLKGVSGIPDMAWAYALARSEWCAGAEGPHLTVRTRLIHSCFCMLLIVGSTGWWVQSPTATAHMLPICSAAGAACILIAAFAMRAVTAPLAALLRQTRSARKDLRGQIQYARLTEFSALAGEINALVLQAEAATTKAAQLQDQLAECRQELERERSLREEQITRQSRDLVETAEIAAKDELTGLANRREAVNQLGLFWRAKKIQGPALACIMLDIDHFKSINDSYGHAAGDVVLRNVATTLRKSVRATDTVSRVGGEEFLVLCPSARCGALGLVMGVAGRSFCTTT